mgnify:CR=1 FL=1
MNKIGTDIISFSVLLIGAIVMLCSCHDDSYPVPSSETEGMRRNLVISLTVQQPGVQSPTSRAPFDTGYELGFTKKECQIHTLTLIMMGVYNGEELFETWQTIEPSEPTNGIYDVQFTLSGITGTKHFYILANAEQKHINAFWAKDRIFDAGEGLSGHNIVGNLMEINHNENGDGEGSNILMAGIVKSNSGDRDIVIPTGDGNEDTDEKITIDTPINLVRTVAKVLLTCMPSKESNNHVAVIDAKDKDNDNNTTDNTGWIQLAEVNYMLNVLNRKTYIDYRTDTDDNAYLKDPNYGMSEWLEKKVSGDETTYGIKDLDAYQKEFLFYDTQDMVEMLNTSIPTYKGGEPCMVRTATLYDKNRIGKENATSRDHHYTEGLYCTENTVYKDMTFANEADFQSAIRYVTTRVMVGAKYTPKVIWDGGDKPKTAQTEKEAQEILDGVEGVDNPLEPVTYPAGTFWRDSDGNYYSLAGMKKKLQDAHETKFSRYDGGWGYYYTYIDENAQNGAISKDTQTRWGIKRNHYYILRVEKIVAPGSPFPGNETMRIHSELVDWVDKGSSEVEIKVPQQSETAQP